MFQTAIYLSSMYPLCSSEKSQKSILSIKLAFSDAVLMQGPGNSKIEIKNLLLGNKGTQGKFC